MPYSYISRSEINQWRTICTFHILRNSFIHFCALSSIEDIQDSVRFKAESWIVSADKISVKRLTQIVIQLVKSECTWPLQEPSVLLSSECSSLLESVLTKAGCAAQMVCPVASASGYLERRGSCLDNSVKSCLCPGPCPSGLPAAATHLSTKCFPSQAVDLGPVGQFVSQFSWVTLHMVHSIKWSSDERHEVHPWLMAFPSAQREHSPHRALLTTHLSCLWTWLPWSDEPTRDSDGFSSVQIYLDTTLSVNPIKGC